MAQAKIVSGAAYTTTSAGSGDMALDGSTVAGYVNLKTAYASGEIGFFRIDDGAGTWEVVLGTRLGPSGGDRIMRLACRRNSSGGTSLITWGAGTKTISAVIPGEEAPSVSQENSWGADQHFAGYKVTLNAGKTTYVQASTQSSAEVLDATVNNVLALRLKQGEMRLFWDDAGTGAGPNFIGDRGSETPAAGDDLTRFVARGRDDGGGSEDYFDIYPEIASPVAGATAGRAALRVKASGAWQETIKLEAGKAYTPSGVNFYVGKASGDSGDTAGAQLMSDGQTFLTRAGIVLYLNRTGSNGTALQFRRDGTDSGRIDVTTTSVGFVQPSDLRLKDAVEPYLDSGALFDTLAPVTWLWKADGTRGWGLIAQDLQELRPDLVSAGGAGYLGIRYEGFIPDLLAEVKVLRARVAALEAAA